MSTSVTPMSKATSKSMRAVLTVTFLSFGALVALVSAIYSGSVALQMDAFHILAGAIKVASTVPYQNKSTQKLTFGNVRAEAVGGFLHASFMVSIAFFFLTNIAKRLLDAQKIAQPVYVLWAAITGASVRLSLLAFLMTSEPEPEPATKKKDLLLPQTNMVRMYTATEQPHDVGGHLKQSHIEKKKKKLNYKVLGSFLLFDMATSLLTIAIALVLVFLPKLNNQALIDPLCSIVKAVILIADVLPRLRTSTDLFMLRSATDRRNLTARLRNVKGVSGAHDVHSWQMETGKEIACAHVVVKRDSSGAFSADLYNQIVADAHRELGLCGVVATTVQIEIVEHSEKDMNACYTSDARAADQCCGDQVRRKLNLHSDPKPVHLAKQSINTAGVEKE